jgi:hypothetical protein
MPKLPDFTDLNGSGIGPARSFTNIPVPDIAGAARSVAAGIGQIGTSIANVQEDRREKAAKQERFDTKMGLLKAEEAYADAVKDLDPLAPDYVEKKRARRREIFAPVLSNVKDPENRQFFDLSTQEDYVNIGIRAEGEHRTALGKKAELDIDTLVENGQRRIREKEDAQKVLAEVTGAIDDNQYVDEVSKEVKRKAATNILLSDAVETNALDGYGKLSGGAVMRALVQAESSGNPNAVSPKGALGLTQVMPTTAPEIAAELGDDKFFQMSEAERTKYLKDPAVSLRYGTHYLNKMLRRYDGDLEAALIAYNAGAGRADEWLKAGRDWNVVRQRNPKAKWMDESQPYVEKIFGLLGIDKATAGSDPRLAGTKDDVLLAVEEDPLFRQLPVDKQDEVRSSVSTRLKKTEEQDKIQLQILKADMKTAIASDIASVADGGEPSADLTYEKVATVLGGTEAEDWRKKREDASEQAQITGGFLSMSNNEIEATVQDYEQQIQPFKGTPDYSRKLQVLKNVKDKQKAIVTERRQNPSQAAFRYPSVQDAYKNYLDIRSEAARNPNEDRNKTVTEAFGRYLETSTEAQIGFGIPRQGVAIVPDEVADGVASLFLDLPATIAGRQDNIAARDTLSRVYEQLKGTFGDYADEVIAYSLAKTKPLSRETTQVMTGLLTSLAKGKSIRRTTADTAQRLQDADEADPGLMGFFDWFNSGQPEEDTQLGNTTDETIPIEDTAGAR